MIILIVFGEILNLILNLMGNQTSNFFFYENGKFIGSLQVNFKNLFRDK